MLDPSRCLWKVLWNLMSCKEKDLGFRVWYFLLARVPKLLAWEVGLDSLSTFHGSAVHPSSVSQIWGVQSLVLLLGRFGGLSVSECFIVPQMNCRLAVSSMTRPGNHDTNEGNQPGPRAMMEE